jgi:monoamine oxidase
MPRSPLFRKLMLALQKARQENLTLAKQPMPILKRKSQYSRRSFLKGTMALGATGLLTSCLSSNKTAKPGSNNTNIAIIGAGIAGLNAAYQLKKAGLSSTVYEASKRVGGRMLSIEWDDGLQIDLGAELINTDHQDMLELAEELNVKLFNRVEDIQNLGLPVVAYYFEGKSILEAELVEDLRLIAEQISSDAALLDKDWDTNAPLFDVLSVEAYLAKHADKIKKPYLNEIFKDMMRTEFGVETKDSTSLQFIQILPVIDGESVDLLSYSDEVYSVIGGSSKITDAIGQKLAENIKLEMALTSIKKRGKKYLLNFSNGTIVEAGTVIIAIPFPVLSGIQIDAKLPEDLTKFIQLGKLGLNEKVIGSFSSRVWRNPKGFTDAAWSDLGFAEAWDTTSRQNTRKDGALNFFLGGDQVQQLKPTDDAKTIGSKFVNRLDPLLSGIKAASKDKFIKTDWKNNPWIKGGYASYKPGELTEFGGLLWIESEKDDERQETRSDNLFFIGEHLSDEYYGFMNGGAQTGRLAANRIAIEANKKT